MKSHAGEPRPWVRTYRATCVLSIDSKCGIPGLVGPKRNMFCAWNMKDSAVFADLAFCSLPAKWLDFTDKLGLSTWEKQLMVQLSVVEYLIMKNIYFNKNH